jgi:hypothetical protein
MLEKSEAIWEEGERPDEACIGELITKAKW